MRVLVCGDRNWKDGEFIRQKLARTWVAADVFGDFTVIHGGANGADTLGGIAAENLLMPVIVFRANWKKYGRAAGPIRNQQMLDEGKPDLVLAFHDDLEHSKGTKDMVTRATKAGIKVEVVKHEKKKKDK